MSDLSTIEARKALAGKYAVKYGLLVELVCAVAEQESSWNQYAARFEGAFYGKYIQPLMNNGTVTDRTEANFRATSIGLMQTMGQVVRELGFKGQLLALTDPDTSLDWGCMKLMHCMDATQRVISDALLRYNGGGNPQYAPQVMARMEKYAT